MEEEDSKAPTSAASTASNSSDNDSSEPETELMVTSRVRRTTAGNRYNNVVSQEQAAEDEEDDVALLFAEIEGEDEEYHSDDRADDADMSSSDDDDQGPNVAADDMEGEKEIQREAKVERAKKRKADLALTSISGLRKKPKIDPTALRRAPAPKPSKRKERVSWLPDQGFAPGRTSLRKQTLEHRAETHAKLKKNEQKRLKAKSIRAQREKEREADAPAEWTQADRLAEAERVERRNAKSLNRWEAMEKKRQEEQAAKLAALKDRKLQGAVVSLHSARHVFQGWRNKDNPEGEIGEVRKRGRKSKAYLEQLAAAKLLQETSTSNVPVAHSNTPAPQLASDVTAPDIDPQIIPPTESHSPQVTNADPAESNAANHESLTEGMPETQNTLKIEEQKPLGSIDPPEPAKLLPVEVEAEVGLPEQHLKDVPIVSQDTSADVVESNGAKKDEQDQVQADTDTLVVESDNNGQREQDTVILNAGPAVMHGSAGSMDQQPVEDVITVKDSQLGATETEAKVDDPVIDQMSQNIDQHASATEIAPVPDVVSIRNLVTLENFDSLSSQRRTSMDFSTPLGKPHLNLSSIRPNSALSPDCLFDIEIRLQGWVITMPAHSKRSRNCDNISLCGAVCSDATRGAPASSLGACLQDLAAE